MKLLEPRSGKLILNMVVLAVSVAAMQSIALPTAKAQEHQASALEGRPPAEDVPEEFLGLLSDQGIQVKRGSRTVCEIWLCKEWDLEAGFSATNQRLYPFSPGQLIGVLHFPRRGKDFRDQSMSSGWYTLRFGLQPIDGNHVGTSPTRDFLLMVSIDQDEVGKNWDEDGLNMASSEAAGTTHPGMLCLQEAVDAESLTMRHREDFDWWILHVVGKGKSGEKSVDVPLDVIVAGTAIE